MAELDERGVVKRRSAVTAAPATSGTPATPQNTGPDRPIVLPGAAGELVLRWSEPGRQDSTRLGAHAVKPAPLAAITALLALALPARASRSGRSTSPSATASPRGWATTRRAPRRANRRARSPAPGRRRDAEVRNRGLGGEPTTEGSRASTWCSPRAAATCSCSWKGRTTSRAASPWRPPLNLREMASKAEERGMGVVHATVIPRLPEAKRRPREHRHPAAQPAHPQHRRQHRPRPRRPHFVFSTAPDPFGRLYYSGNDDPVGHPNAAATT